MRSILVGLLILTVFHPTLSADDADSAQTVADPYVPAELVQGELELVGSRTMSELAAIWADGFIHIHPDVEISLSFEGSETALEQLSAQGTTLGLISRDLTEHDQAAFAEDHPDTVLIPVTTGFDALAVVVHPDNPVESLTIEQLALLFGTTSEPAPTNWGVLDVGDDFADMPLRRTVTGEHSGSYEHFRTLVLGGNEFAESESHDWHAEIVETVATDPGAIGFVSLMNSRSESVRVVPLSIDDDHEAMLPTSAAIAAHDYPLTRPLTLVIAAPADGLSHPLLSEFVRYVLSEFGQFDVVKDGFQPLGRRELLEQYDRLGWNTIK